jgi:hypothetical protein
MEQRVCHAESFVHRRCIPGDPDAGVRRLDARSSNVAQRVIAAIPCPELGINVLRIGFRSFVGILAGVRKDHHRRLCLNNRNQDRV